MSLVRTQRVGYMCDPTRWTVALSRARLGLYIVGCEPLLRKCKPVEQFLSPLWKMPTKLAVPVLGEESFGDEFSRRVSTFTVGFV